MGQNVIAIDVKSSRHSFDATGHILHRVSAFVTEARLVLAQEKVSEKSNEITAIPKLLEWLDLRSSTVTIDDIGCQHAIASQIIAKGGEYIFSLKGNQGTLNDDVRDYFQGEDLYKDLTLFEDWDKGHGRIEVRKCWVTQDVDWLYKRHPHWKSIGEPQTALSKVCSHWGIENTLHWVLDMSFGDGPSRIRKENAPHIMAIIRHMILNLLHLQKNRC